MRRLPAWSLFVLGSQQGTAGEGPFPGGVGDEAATLAAGPWADCFSVISTTSSPKLRAARRGSGGVGRSEVLFLLYEANWVWFEPVPGPDKKFCSEFLIKSSALTIERKM